MNSEVLKKLVRYNKFNQEYSAGNTFGRELDELLSDIAETDSATQSSNHDSVYKNEITLNNTSTKIEADPAIPMITDEWAKCDNLHEFSAMIQGCEKCGMLSKGRKNIVFGSGNPRAGIVVVGEAPGADEDEQGLPFVGRAGRLLTDILAAINLSRDEVYICNILKCRPPENRNPQPDEISNCEPYLAKQLELIKPKLILALGTFAAQTLLNTKEPLGKLRGRFHLYKNIKLMVTYHPAALLRNPNWKRPTWEDVKMFREEYDNIRGITNERH
jgi:uracil-DNA glycosylase family 4